MQRISISVVIPVYSGEGYLKTLVEELAHVRAEWAADETPFMLAEALFVNDGAIDNSATVLDEIAVRETWVSIIHMSRNFGQHPATIAGILHSSGDWVVTLDEDLQHPPKAISQLLRKAAETRADVVYANSEDIHDNAMRDLSSRGFKWLVGHLTNNRDIQKVNSFRLMRGSIARAASSACIHDTYFDVALSWFTDRIEAVSMKLKDERFIETGKSGYRLRSLLSHARRMLISSHLKVLRTVTLFGLIVFAVSVLTSLMLVIARMLSLYEASVTGWTSTIVTLNLYGGIIVMLIGFVLEYLSILIQRAHGRPLFFIVDRTTDESMRRYFGAQDA